VDTEKPRPGLFRIAVDVWGATGAGGVVTMAVVQLAQGTCCRSNPCGRRQRDRNPGGCPSKPGLARTAGPRSAPKKRLKEPASIWRTGRHSRALLRFYRSSQLAGQLRARRPSPSLDFPSRHEPLLRMMATGARPLDLQTWLAPAPDREPMKQELPYPTTFFIRFL